MFCKSKIGKVAPSTLPKEQLVIQSDIDFIRDYLKNSEYATIPYRYNRAVIFKSHNFHTTDNVHMKSGHKNRRISYTFLYNK